MTITYIIPTVGRPSIAHTIESILREDKNARILIQRGGTAGDNRNKLLLLELLFTGPSESQSDFLCFVDDDDVYLSGFRKQIDPKFDVIVLRMNQNGTIIPREDNELRGGNVGINLAIKTDFLRAICVKDGQFDTSYLFDDGHAEDWRFLEKILKHNPAVKITDEVFYHCSQVNHIAKKRKPKFLRWWKR